jgi:GxxExxY protein
MRYSFEPISGEILAAAVEVHKHLGPGFRESVYESALAVEFKLRGVPFSRQQRVVITYKSEPVGQHRLDFVTEGILMEIKAATELVDLHTDQTLSYLKSSGIRTGLLLNFGAARLQSRRVVL